jgi:diguanylate cyclase (GGDEF)-like protein
MRQLFSRSSTTQLIAISVAGALALYLAASVAPGSLGVVAAVFAAGVAALLHRALRPLNDLRNALSTNEEIRAELIARAATVNRLLEFSQTIQGAGKVDQVYAGLSHYLQRELELAGIAILAHTPDEIPATQLKAAYPDDLIRSGCNPAEMETCLCPCLRQNLPRHFRADGSPVRCSVDALLRLDASHAAYCIPFNVGGRTNVLVHMLLPPGQDWSEQRKQIAHTYVNAANSTLISLNLLSEAEKQSMTDVLTGLYNRRSMEALLQREVALAERHGHSFSIVMIDMDNFKEINDEFGHAAGDHMLRAFADCVRITLRKTDLAFRYGGDEFVIALPQTPLVQAQAVVQKLRQAYASVDFSHAIARLDHQPTLSIGVAERSKSANTLTLPSLLTAADQALYDAKNSNRNCIKVYQPPAAA